MKPFVSYLKNQSPPMQMAYGSTGWLELPSGQRWNPAHSFKFSGTTPRRPWWYRLMGLIRGSHGH